MPRSSLWILFVSLLSLAQNAPGQAPPTPMHVAGTIFGDDAEIEIRDLTRSAAEAALADAWAALGEAEVAAHRLELVTAKGDAATLEVTPDEARLLGRSVSFCAWSDGATSALGARIHSLWGFDSPVAEIPTPARLEPAIDAARCPRLRVDEEKGRIELDPGAALDLRSFSRGWAIDRAAGRLRDAGAGNFYIRIGAVARAVGGGPAGRGWRFEMPLFPGLVEPLSALRLVDQSVAVADPSRSPIEIAGERFAPYVDLRSGRPASGIAGVTVVSELAGDAEPLAAALFVFGANAGQMRLGVLRPRPSVLWLLGSPEAGAPVLATANWSGVKKQ
ncbi:MAG: FAD:protein FMN transferase [Thermoanaerobaculia bacterium]